MRISDWSSTCALPICAALAGAGIADVHALALEVLEGLDVGILARDHGERLGIHREHRAQLLERDLLEGLRQSAVVRVLLPVRLRPPEVEVVVAYAVGFFDGLAGGRGAICVNLEGWGVGKGGV